MSSMPSDGPSGSGTHRIEMSAITKMFAEVPVPDLARGVDPVAEAPAAA